MTKRWGILLASDNKKLVPDEKESKIVKLIFETYVEMGSIAGKR